MFRRALRATLSVAPLAFSAACAAPSADSSGPATPEPASANAIPAQVDRETDAVAALLAELGVRIDRARGELEIDGWVNQREGAVEVFACAPLGKTHESIVVLDCVPSGLHAGLLALGLAPGTPAVPHADGSEDPPTGERVEVRVRWRDDSGRERTARAEEWVGLADGSRAMSARAWVFTGSYTQPADDGSVDGSGESVFAADRVKTLVSTYRDPSTILENPGEDAIDDSRYVANTRTVPPVGTRLTAIFRRAEAPR